MSGNVKQFVDFSTNTNNDTGENNAASIAPILDGEGVTGTVLTRPSESLRQRTEAIRNVMSDTLYLRDADRGLVVTGPTGVAITWPGSTTASQTGIPVLSNALWLIPLLTPGAAGNTPPVASTFGVLHLKRASDSANAISVTSARRSYAAGDQINVTVTAGAVFSCVLDVETGFRRTIKIVATGSTTLGTVISALNGLTPPAPDNTQLVVAALEGGALSGDLILTTQARQYVAGNYDGETHQISAGTLASFFTSNPTQALAEGDSLCIRYDMVADTASTGGRRQSIPENANVSVPTGSLFNSRVHPEFLTNAIPVCKVVGGALVFPGGRTIPAGAVNVTLAGNAGSDLAYGGGGAWADGTTNPATSIEAQLDKIISDLSPATGSAKIGGAASGTDIAAGTIAAQIANLAVNWLKLNRANTITALQTFTQLITASGGITAGGLITASAGLSTTTALASGLVTASAGITVGANQNITLSGSGKLKHGIVTLQFPFGTANSNIAPFVTLDSSHTFVSRALDLPIGVTIDSMRVIVKDSATGPQTLASLLNGWTTALVNSPSVATNNSNGSGNVQTLTTATGLGFVVTSGQAWIVDVFYNGGASTQACTASMVEIDIFQA